MRNRIFCCLNKGKGYVVKKLNGLTRSLEVIEGAIQVLRNAVGGGRVSAFPEKSVTTVYCAMLLALRGGGWGSNSQEKSVT